VQTLSGAGFGDLPSAARQGRMPAEELAALADEIGMFLSSAGVNLDLAPVVDVVPEGTEDANAPSAPTTASTAAPRRPWPPPPEPSLAACPRTGSPPR
jgi:hypothetical protein